MYQRIVLCWAIVILASTNTHAQSDPPFGGWGHQLLQESWFLNAADLDRDQQTQVRATYDNWMLMADAIRKSTDDLRQQRRRLDKLQDEMTKKIFADMQPQQAVRMRQILEQRKLGMVGGSYGLYLAERGERFGLSDDQLQRIKEVRKQARLKQHAAAEKFTKQVEEIIAEENADALELLSVQQREKLDDRLGEPFQGTAQGHPAMMIGKEVDDTTSKPNDRNSTLWLMMKMDHYRDYVELVDEQLAEIAEIRSETETDRAAIEKKGLARDQQDMELVKLYRENLDKMLNVLLPHQRTRLDQIYERRYLRFYGDSYCRYLLSKFGDLELSEQQKKRLDALFKDVYQPKLLTAAKEFRAIVEANLRDEQSDVVKVLNDDQRQQLTGSVGELVVDTRLDHPANSALRNFIRKK